MMPLEQLSKYVLMLANLHLMKNVNEYGEFGIFNLANSITDD